MPSDKVTVYLDDILVHSESLEEHLEDIQQVFKLLKDHGLKLSPEKCKLFQEKIEYLGFMVGNHNGKYGYSPLEKKINALAGTEMPTTAKEVRSFTGGLQYYNHMIENLNIMLAPLHKGAAKTPFVMTDEMKNAFLELKDKLGKQIMLAFPDFSLPFKLSTDASFKGAAGILSQHHPDGREEIIYTFSKTFDDVQTRWAIVELECLALVWCLDKMKELLLGKPFIWLTDSMVLKQMIENPSRDLSRSGRKIHRYIDFINQFQMEIRHEKGDKPETALADFFSRAPVAAIQNFFRSQLSREEWEIATAKDTALQSRSGPWQNYAKKIFEEDKIFYLEAQPRCKIAVPSTLVNKVIDYYHTSYTMHAGISRIISLITGLYVWPHMYNDIKKFINNCETCAKSKNLPLGSGYSRSIETPIRPMQWVQIDLVMVSPKPSDKGNKYVLTCICCLTNYLQMEAIPSKESIVVLKALCKIFCQTGVPEVIQSDNGKEFASVVMQNHAKWMNIEWRFSTPYKPSTNGRIERRHADLAKLMKILDCNSQNWCDELPYITFELNSTLDTSVGSTPFEQFHGWSARIPHLLRDIPTGTSSTDFNEWAHQVDRISWEAKLRSAQDKAFSNIKNQRDAHKNQFQRSQEIEAQLVPGDLVMVKLPGSGKLTKKLHGPYKVTKVSFGGSFTAEEVNGSKTVRLPASHARRIKSDSGELGEQAETRRQTRGKQVDYSSFFREEEED